MGYKSVAMSLLTFCLSSYAIDSTLVGPECEWKFPAVTPREIEAISQGSEKRTVNDIAKIRAHKICLSHGRESMKAFTLRDALDQEIYTPDSCVLSFNLNPLSIGERQELVTRGPLNIVAEQFYLLTANGWGESLVMTMDVPGQTIPREEHVIVGYDRVQKKANVLDLLTGGVVWADGEFGQFYAANRYDSVPVTGKVSHQVPATKKVLAKMFSDIQCE